MSTPDLSRLQPRAKKTVAVMELQLGRLLETHINVAHHERELIIGGLDNKDWAQYFRLSASDYWHTREATLIIKAIADKGMGSELIDHTALVELLNYGYRCCQNSQAEFAPIKRFVANYEQELIDAALKKAGTNESAVEYVKSGISDFEGRPYKERGK